MVGWKYFCDGHIYEHLGIVLVITFTFHPFFVIFLWIMLCTPTKLSSKCKFQAKKSNGKAVNLSLCSQLFLLTVPTSFFLLLPTFIALVFNSPSFYKLLPEPSFPSPPSLQSFLLKVNSKFIFERTLTPWRNIPMKIISQCVLVLLMRRYSHTGAPSSTQLKMVTQNQGYLD